MSEYIITDKQLKTATEAYLEHELSRPITEVFISGDKLPKIVRCRDCKHATISSLGYVKYCEKFVLPDEDGYGADPQVMLPSDFFCGYGELRGDAE